MRLRHLLFLLLPGALTVSPAAGQTRAEWNSEHVLELIARARARRLLPQADTSLHNYRARAEGFVYFYLDRAESEERTLVKTDQIALEMYWAQPNLTKQRIVGLRDRSRLPNRMYYHLDHLTVVQNGFGDVIRIGDGDEVRDVPHPAARGSEAIYDFRLADSLDLRMSNVAAPVRVYEINVRPKRTDRSALVGSIFLDRATADIIRMTFTFTPASYVDRRLDYIQISLDNALFLGRYWLPNEQRLEIRRQLPELDFAAGAVILGRMRISDYTFNDTLPATLFTGYPVVAVPDLQREQYPFEHDIYADLDEAGLKPAPEMAELRAQAAELLKGKRLSGLPKLRLQLASASSAFRYNRAEGLYLGTGATYSPRFGWAVDTRGGFAFGSERPSASLRLRHTGTGSEVSLAGFLNDPRDLGVSLPLAPALNTLSAVLLGDDYLDPYRSSGARLAWRPAALGSWRLELGAAAERQRSASLEQLHPPFDDSATFRPVRPIDPGDQYALDARLERPVPDGQQRAWGAGLSLLGGAFEQRGFVRGIADATVQFQNPGHSRALELRTQAGITSGRDPAAQQLFLLGGAGTLPGHEYRSFAGSRFGLLQAEFSQDLLRPWLRLRLVGAAGAAGGLPDSSAHAWRNWEIRGTDGVKFSAGAGVSLFWDIIRIDRVRGLGGGGRWVFQLSANPDFADIT